jgi:hypothetical protein
MQQECKKILSLMEECLGIQENYYYINPKDIGKSPSMKDLGC